MRQLVTRILQVFGSALVLMWASELFFFNEGPIQEIFNRFDSGGPGAAIIATLELGMFYMFFSYPLLICLTSFTVHSWAGALLAAGVYGIAVEAVLVPQVYESLPGSIIWPSLSWHMLIDAALIWLGLRLALRARRAWVPALSFFGVGAFWALQSTWYWVELEPGGFPKLDFDHFALLVACAGTGLFLGIVLADTASPKGFRAHWAEIALVAIINVVFFTLTGLPFGMAPLLVAGVVLTLLAGLLVEHARNRKNTTWPPLERLATRPPAWRYLFFLLLPIGALLSYVVILETNIQMPTGPVVQLFYLTGAACTGAALIVQLWALITLWRSRDRHLQN